MKTKIFTREELQSIRKERTRTMELDLGIIPPVLEAPKPFPTIAPAAAAAAAASAAIAEPQIANPSDLAPACALPLSRPSPTDQRNKAVDIHYSGLIRRKPRKPN